MDRRESGQDRNPGVAFENRNQPEDQSGQQKTDSHSERETETKVFAS